MKSNKTYRVNLSVLDDLIETLKEAGISKEDSQAICLSLARSNRSMDEMSLYVMENNPSLEQIMDKMLELVKRDDALENNGQPISDY